MRRKELCKKMGPFLCVCELLLFPACHAEQDAQYDALVSAQKAEADAFASEFEVDYDDPAYIGPPKPEKDDKIESIPGGTLSGELLIKTFNQAGSRPAIYWLAQEFMDMYPEVKIEIEYEWKFGENLSTEEVRIRRESYYTQLRAEMAAGEADYLLYGVARRLDYAGLARSGVLQDMSDRWESDPDIRQEDYFLPVLDAFRVDGKLPVLPYSFSMGGVYFQRRLLEKLHVDASEQPVVDAGDILDWYEQLRQDEPDLQLFFTAEGKDTLFPIESTRYIDLKSRTAHFDSPDFVRFLERTRDTISDDPGLDPETEVGMGGGPQLDSALRYAKTGELPMSAVYMESSGFPYLKNIITKARPSFGVVADTDVYQLVNAVQQSLEYVAGPFPLVSTEGRLGISTIFTDFAMPSSLQNADLAWEFIKYCIGKRDDLTFDHYGYTGQNSYTNGSFPLHKGNFAKALEAAQDTQGSHDMGYAESFHFSPVDGGEMVAYMDELLAHDPVDLGKYNLDLQDYLDEFYINELTTPEQAAEKIQGRTYIWLNE